MSDGRCAAPPAAAAVAAADAGALAADGTVGGRDDVAGATA